jgi:hypothetical protein
MVSHNGTYGFENNRGALGGGGMGDVLRIETFICDRTINMCIQLPTDGKI